MMLCLALRSSPELVYQRALRQFSVEEISEGFAAARGLALPSQLRRMLKAQGRDLHAEFVRLLPAPPQPVSIQRWSLRRVGLLAAVALLVMLLVDQGALSIDYPEAVATPTSVGNLACTDLEPQWLLAQSVPSASLVPCLGPLPRRLVAGAGDGQQRPVGHPPEPRPRRHQRAGCPADGRAVPSRGPSRWAPTSRRYDATSGSTARHPASRPSTSTSSRAAASPPRHPCRWPTEPRSPATRHPSFTTPPGRRSNRHWTSAQADDCDSTHPLLDQLPTRLVGLPRPRNRGTPLPSAEANHPSVASGGWNSGAAGRPLVHPILVEFTEPHDLGERWLARRSTVDL